MEVIQIIFVVETNKITKSDDRYVSKLISQLYDLSKNDVQFQYVHMGTKYRYNKPSVLKEIKEYIQQNKNGINHVVYCFDTDRIDNDQVQVEALKKYENFCIQNGFYFVWFCYDIETVFLGHSVPDNEKEKESRDFFRKKFELEKSLKLRLSKNKDDIKSNRSSNILTVLSELYNFTKEL